MKGFTTIFNCKDADSQTVRLYRQEFGEMLVPGCGNGQTCLKGEKVSTLPVLDPDVDMENISVQIFPLTVKLPSRWH
jgi:hypothetical protein